MNTSWTFHAATVAGFVIAAASPAASQPSIEGPWHVEGGATVVRIGRCAAGSPTYCGVFVALASPNDTAGRPLVDSRNPDPSLRGRPWIGMPILSGFTAVEPDGYAGGVIYDPTSGRSYAAKMRVLSGGSLKVQGCILVVCRSQIWTRTRTTSRLGGERGSSTGVQELAAAGWQRVRRSDILRRPQPWRL